MKQVFFIRHGQSEFNTRKVKAGASNSQLTDKGRKQAAEAGKIYRDYIGDIDVIICSPLERAHETARIVAKHVGYPEEEIILDERLLERDFGELEGRSVEEYGLSQEDYHMNPFAIDHVPGVEKITDLQFRANKFHEHLQERPERFILIVGHGAHARSLVRAIKNAPLTEYIKPIDNAEVVKLI